MKLSLASHALAAEAVVAETASVADAVVVAVVVDQAAVVVVILAAVIANRAGNNRARCLVLCESLQNGNTQQPQSNGQAIRARYKSQEITI